MGVSVDPTDWFCQLTSSPEDFDLRHVWLLRCWRPVKPANNSTIFLNDSLASTFKGSTGIMTGSVHCGAHFWIRISMESAFKATFARLMTPVSSAFGHVSKLPVFKARRRSFTEASKASAIPSTEPSIRFGLFLGILLAYLLSKTAKYDIVLSMTNRSCRQKHRAAHPGSHFSIRTMAGIERACQIMIGQNKFLEWWFVSSIMFWRCGRLIEIVLSFNSPIDSQIHLASSSQIRASLRGVFNVYKVWTGKSVAVLRRFSFFLLAGWPLASSFKTGSCLTHSEMFAAADPLGLFKASIFLVTTLPEIGRIKT